MVVFLFRVYTIDENGTETTLALYITAMQEERILLKDFDIHKWAAVNPRKVVTPG